MNDILIGAEGVIVCIDDDRQDNYCYVIRYDGVRHLSIASSSIIEPIQPERNRVVAWEDCPWRPERLREVA
jgi:hypothetical protein